MSSWAERVIWWQVYPLGFTGAPRRAEPPEGPVVGRLDQLRRWLPYVADLGCNGLALGPVFASQTHGYDTVDHLEVDRRLGDEEDLRRLIDDCHQRGMRVLLDGVFNHVARGFAPFQDVLANGASSAYADWFHLDFSATAGPDGFGYADFEGHRQLVRLNHSHPAVIDYAARVMTHWLDRGADGWRLDAAYAAPAAFWREAIGRVRAAHPGAWFVGEVIHGDYTAFVEQSGMDSVTQYELWKAMWSSLNDRNLFELAWALDRHNEFVQRFLPLTFVGNHDVTRLASRLEDDRHLGHSLAVLFTVAGVPSIYYGDEQGFRGVKEEREGGDDAIRPAFPATPAGLAAYGWPVYHEHQRLIAMRRRNAWLTGARTSIRQLANQQLSYQTAAGRDSIIVLLNLADSTFRFDPATEAGAPRVEAAGHEAGADPWLVPPHSWTILAAEPGGDGT